MTTITLPFVPADEYIDNPWKAVKRKMIRWAGAERPCKAAYLRDQRPIPLPRICRCGRPARLSIDGESSARCACAMNRRCLRAPPRRLGGRCSRCGRLGTSQPGRWLALARL